MQRAVLILFVMLCLTVFMAGCATLERIAPSAVDEQGNVIPGTHALTDTGKAIAGNLGPWGQAAAAIPLLVWNFFELAKAKRDQKGLIATVKALHQASKDPKTKEAFEKIKEYLKNAHSVAGVDANIKALLAKL